MLLLNQSVSNYNQIYIYGIVHNQEQFDLIRAFDYNPTPNFTELQGKMSLLFLATAIYKFFEIPHSATT